MRYAITYQNGDYFENVNTGIIEAPDADTAEAKIPQLLKTLGLEKVEIKYIMEDHMYYIIGCDDVDLYVEEKKS